MRAAHSLGTRQMPLTGHSPACAHVSELRLLRVLFGVCSMRATGLSPACAYASKLCLLRSAQQDTTRKATLMLAPSVWAVYAALFTKQWHPPPHQHEEDSCLLVGARPPG